MPPRRRDCKHEAAARQQNIEQIESGWTEYADFARNVLEHVANFQAGHPPTRWRILERYGGSAPSREGQLQGEASRPPTRWRILERYGGSAFAETIAWRSQPKLSSSVNSLREKSERRLVSRVGIEPTTRRLRVCCSAN